MSASPIDIESVQLPVYFFFPASQVSTPWPTNGEPIASPLKSEIRQSPPQLRVFTSTPFEV